MQNEEKPEYWLGRIKEFGKSKMSIGRWCEANGESVHKLRYWLEKYEADGTIQKLPNRFGRIPEWISLNECENEYNVSNGNCAINIYISSFRITVDSDFDKKALLDVIEVLKKC